ncbi:MAG: hypothetical protein BWY06_02280 [Candidatus Latescibacteria bacterium ADurb.Bin168]|nr:MAG: hypothetical protein BWY06_02280 [Candidatus Latescibacteria bacterium ADurb.Bin168]
MKPRYHLRFQVAPGPNLVADSQILADFCNQHNVEEAVLFVAAEELNNGLLSEAEEAQWFDTIRTAKQILENAGIVVSLNPWMTVLHTDRGRHFPQDRTFAPMVSPEGEVSTACASFADPAWRDYIKHLYSRFASLGFRVLWVEDDFRFHNHAPLTWGGGFEQPVIERFAAKVGKPVTREEIVKAILAPGKPHPWRAVWMETWREIHLETARIIAKAVADSSPVHSAVGLMSSHPSSHSTEGRDWKALFEAFTVSGRVAHRPHFAPYSEATGKTRDWSFMMLDVQRNFRPPQSEVAPEIENFPFTRWSKSDVQTWSEMVLCQFFASDALLLDLFPFTGNSANREPEIGELLDRSCPALEWIASRFSKDMQTEGIGTVWKEDAHAHVRTTRGISMSELNADPFVAGSFLLPYGVTVAMREQPVTALMGNAVWALSDEEIEGVLAGGTLVDGEALDILTRRGFAELLGVVFSGWEERDHSLYSIEEVVSPRAGTDVGLVFNTNVVPRVARVDAMPGAEEWTRIITPARQRVGAGIVAFENRLGARVITYATPGPACLPRSFQRQWIVHRAARFVSRDTPLTLVTGGAYLMPLHLNSGGIHRVVVYNGSPDPARPVVWDSRTGVRPPRVTLLAPLCDPVAAEAIPLCGPSGETGYECSSSLPYHGYAVFEWDDP